MKKFNYQTGREGGNLLDWLEKQGGEIDARCGGRGLCQGCRVLIDGEEFRSCQVSLNTLSDGALIEPILEGSVKKTLHALDSFLMDWTPCSGGKGLGLAIDVGTTTVVMALWDLESGRLLETVSSGNDQRKFGDNVISRVHHGVEGGDQDLHQSLVDKTLKPLYGKLEQKLAGVTERVSRIVVAGNPVMLHTLVQLPLDGFAKYPFTPEFLGRHLAPAQTVGFQRHDLEAELLPGMGAFVGADIIAGALASGMIDGHKKVLLIDFGTNGEILLKNHDEWSATATAVGPAFEGGLLACGRPADAHAVHHLDLQNQHWVMIGDQENTHDYKGFAGSAYIDYLALALDEGWIGERGRYEKTVPGLEDTTGPCGSVLQQNFGKHIYITEVDLAELLKAKAAIEAGIQALLIEAGLKIDDIDQLIVAGGFGYHMNLAHAMRVGLLPQIDPNKVKIVGNSSLGGASRVLLEKDLIFTLENLSQRVKVIELNLLDSFEDLYLDALCFELPSD